MCDAVNESSLSFGVLCVYMVKGCCVCLQFCVNVQIEFTVRTLFRPRYTTKGAWSKRRQTKPAKVKTATFQNGDKSLSRLLN